MLYWVRAEHAICRRFVHYTAEEEVATQVSVFCARILWCSMLTEVDLRCLRRPNSLPESSYVQPRVRLFIPDNDGGL